MALQPSMHGAACMPPAASEHLVALRQPIDHSLSLRAERLFASGVAPAAALVRPWWRCCCNHGGVQWRQQQHHHRAARSSLPGGLCSLNGVESREADGEMRPVAAQVATMWRATNGTPATWLSRSHRVALACCDCESACFYSG